MSRAQRTRGGGGYWLQLPAEWWPSLAAGLGKPWPAEAAAFDLRFWADRARHVGEERPAYRALADRWGWAPGQARGFLRRELEARPELNAHPDRATTPGPRSTRRTAAEARAALAQNARSPRADRAQTVGEDAAGDGACGKLARAARAPVAQTARDNRSTRVPSRTEPKPIPRPSLDPAQLVDMWRMGMRDDDTARLLGYWVAGEKAGMTGGGARAQRVHALGEWVAGWPDEVVAALPDAVAEALCIGPATLGTCRASVPPERRRRPERGELPRWPG